MKDSKIMLEDINDLVFGEDVVMEISAKTRENGRKDENGEFKHPQIEQNFEFDFAGVSLFDTLERYTLPKLRILVQGTICRPKEDATSFMQQNPRMLFSVKELMTPKAKTPKEDPIQAATRNLQAIYNSGLDPDEMDSLYLAEVNRHPTHIKQIIALIWKGMNK